jgi:ComF family protein
MPALARPLRTIVDFVLPPRCPGCGTITPSAHRFCAACWQSLRFITPPWCAACQRPFPYDRGAGAVCGACLARPPLHAGVRAAVIYGDIARGVALRLKYGGRLGLAETVADAMVRLVPDDADLLVPVPLHRWRLWSRGFNQAALIARALARRRALSADALALRRTRRTPALRGLGARQRARTLTGAFAVAPGAADRLRGRHIVLIDDVYTSGATTEGCTRVLLAAGAGRVTILCWARVLEERDD